MLSEKTSVLKVRQFRENVIMVTNGVRIVVTAGHLRIMVTTEGV